MRNPNKLSTSLSILLLLRLFSIPCLSSSSSSSSDGAALLSFKAKADLSNRLHFFANHTNSTYYCNWPGVQCSPQSRITRLVLGNLQLNGTFAGGTLERLDQLRILSLKANSLTGPIPDLSALTNLKALFLDHNLFTGSFPPSLFSLHRLRTLDLSHNELAGPIPFGILALDRLNYLRLDSNRFNGSVPPLNQTALRIFNVSKNELSGAVPVTDALRAFDASVFSGNPGLCGEAVRRECGSHLFFFHGAAPAGSNAPTPAATAVEEGQVDGRGILLPGSNSSASTYGRLHKRGFVVIGFSAAAFLVIGFVGISIVVNKRKRTRQGKILSEEKNQEVLRMERHDSHGSNNVNAIEEIENSNNELVAAAAMSEEKVKKMGRSGSLVFCAGEAQVYTLEQLMRASAEMLGRGHVGSTYKAVLDNRLIVSVKRLDAAKMGATGKEVFERHMEAVGRLRHPNLVPLRAYFQAKEERLLVYDYQPNGSLFSLIHGSRSTRAKPLHWTSCLKIAEDIAQGLAYIHQASRLVHGNLKSSNVLLGADFEACLTDSCLLSLIEPPPSDSDQEDFGYRAPETHKSNSRLTPRSDIYAFGVLLLELLTGKPPLHQNELMAADFPTWVRSVREDEGSDDERLMMIVDIAAACVQSSPESRPTTWQVLKMIQEVKAADAEGDNENDSLIIL